MARSKKSSTASRNPPFKFSKETLAAWAEKEAWREQERRLPFAEKLRILDQLLKPSKPITTRRKHAK